jgi:hypothetical protein
MSRKNRKRHNAESMNRLIEAWEQSGRRKAEFCAASGIPICVFDYWRRKQQAIQVEYEQRVGFTEVKAPEPSRGNTECQLRLHYPDGRVLEFVSAPGVNFLREVLTW